MLIATTAMNAATAHQIQCGAEVEQSYTPVRQYVIICLMRVVGGVVFEAGEFGVGEVHCCCGGGCCECEVAEGAGLVGVGDRRERHIVNQLVQAQQWGVSEEGDVGGVVPVDGAELAAE